MPRRACNLSASMPISAIVAHIALPFTNGVTTNEHGVGPDACEGTIAGYRLALAADNLY